jgi:hypothetical protein
LILHLPGCFARHDTPETFFNKLLKPPLRGSIKLQEYMRGTQKEEFSFLMAAITGIRPAPNRSERGRWLILSRRLCHSVMREACGRVQRYPNGVKNCSLADGEIPSPDSER